MKLAATMSLRRVGCVRCAAARFASGAAAAAPPVSRIFSRSKSRPLAYVIAVDSRMSRAYLAFQLI